eukprot:IDg3696t1
MYFSVATVSSFPSTLFLAQSRLTNCSCFFCCGRRTAALVALRISPALASSFAATLFLLLLGLFCFHRSRCSSSVACAFFNHHYRYFITTAASLCLADTLSLL